MKGHAQRGCFCDRSNGLDDNERVHVSVHANHVGLLEECVDETKSCTNEVLKQAKGLLRNSAALS